MLSLFFFHFVESELLNLFLGVTGPIAHAIQPFFNFNSFVKPRPIDYWVSCCVTKHYHCSSQLSSFEVILRALIVVNRSDVVCDGKKQNKKKQVINGTQSLCRLSQKEGQTVTKSTTVAPR